MNLGGYRLVEVTCLKVASPKLAFDVEIEDGGSFTATDLVGFRQPDLGWPTQ